MTNYPLFVMVVAAIGVFAVLSVLYVIRSAKPPTSLRGSTMAYFESIKKVDPEEGIDYVVNYIQNPKWGCPPGDLLDFLLEMVKRTDGFGEAARRKIKELGLLPDV
jgi:hypothetical protein